MFEELINTQFGGSFTIGILFIVFTLSAFSLLFTFVRFRLLEIEFVRFLKKNRPEVLKNYQQKRTWLKILKFLKEYTFDDDKCLLRIKRKVEQWDLIGKASVIVLALAFTALIISTIMLQSA